MMAADAAIEDEADIIEEEKERETLDWVEEEERKEKEAVEAEHAAQLEKDEEWMVEQLKKEQGDNFGDDIDLDFSE